MDSIEEGGRRWSRLKGERGTIAFIYAIEYLMVNKWGSIEEEVN